ncbi:GGDEF domain-containing protein [Brevibacillus sp. 179-C9.3 HS]|uniref:GGDEF domain-containing protein n=1 Tax=unclassified Brevibacillus TaxID=2684853 RepID=UPI0039A3747E
MRERFSKNGKFISYQVLFLLFIILLALFAVGMPALPLISSLLLGWTLVISLTGIIFGLLTSLGLALISLFAFGSLLIWGMFASWTISFSFSGIVVWMGLFLGAAVLTGLIHRLVSQTVAEHQEMVGKFDELVTIDEVTGFSNEKRLLFDLEEECSRSRRTGIPFSLMLIEVLYLDSFYRLYGPKEGDYLLSSLSSLIRNNTRLTDRKFRLDRGEQGSGTFAVILSNSHEEGAEVVVKKIEKLLSVHNLENDKKQVTLTIGFGISHYAEDVSDHLEMVQRAKQELEQYIQ